MRAFVLLLSITDHHVVLSSGKLFMSSVTWSDVGVYQCVAVNPLTTSRRVSSSHVNLLVQGASESFVYLRCGLSVYDRNSIISRPISITFALLLPGMNVENKIRHTFIFLTYLF